MNDWPVVARFGNMPDAHIALGLLKSENIPCYLQDENLAQTLNSIPVGGIRLRVPPDYEDQAIRILGQDYSHHLDTNE